MKLKEHRNKRSEKQNVTIKLTRKTLFNEERNKRNLFYKNAQERKRKARPDEDPGVSASIKGREESGELTTERRFGNEEGSRQEGII